MLERLENEIVEMKVTLSYFIDPNPGLSANLDASVISHTDCGLTISERMNQSRDLNYG